MLANNGEALIALADDKWICIEPGMINRHGLITGATGTGKTVSLQTLAETFSQLGISVFMADVKGDLSGMAEPAGTSGKLAERAKELGLDAIGRKPQAFPVCFWDALGKKGHPMRATISDIGPVLLARALNLNDVQSGVLQIVFKIADSNGLLLLDLKDLRSMVLHVGEERENYRSEYGLISPASIGAIQRALLRLEEEGGDQFFGEPALDVMDLIQTVESKGMINILDATTLINTPLLYSCVLLWLLSELFERLPETGDAAKPKIAFFFDEAHLLFDGIPAPLLQKIEQMARLIRSRGVGIYFVSQSPSDIPDAILGQLGNRVQHALRAFTPKDQKAVRAAAQAFRPNPAFDTAEAISNLAIGEALISFLDKNGAPQMVEKALVVPPQGKSGTIDDRTRLNLMRKSPVAGVYDNSVDRESAYEILAERALRRQAEEDEARRIKEMEKQRKAQEKEARATFGAPRRPARQPAGGDLLGSLMRQTTRTVGSTVGRELGKAVLRGLLGGLMGGKK